MATQHPHEAVTWPCHKCAAPGVRNLGSQGWCTEHLEQLYTTFDRGAFAFHGVGLQAGSLRPDFGPNHVDLRCNACAATWTGLVGDPCEWCVGSLQRILAHQAELVLRPPEVDPNDARCEAIYEAWTGRLRVAIDAGIIDEADAERVLRREGTRAA